jgi:hypothetical protein
MKNLTLYIVATILAAFGLLTLFLSGSVLFDLFEIRAKEGNYVPLVVWANFIASFLYLVTAYGFFKQKKWTTMLLGISLVVLILGSTGLFIHINAGGIYEEKTPKAMAFRTIVTLLFLLYSNLIITKKLKKTVIK